MFLISRRGTCDQASYIAVVVVVYRQGDHRCRSVTVVSVQIHIDAHSDDDNPEYVAGMPFFRYPKTDSEISYFMQKNDVFVQVCMALWRYRSFIIIIIIRYLHTHTRGRKD